MRRFVTIMAALAVMISCKKPYSPPETEISGSILVVEGTIATGSNTENRFLLSRVKTLQDTSVNIPESGASVSIESENGSSWILPENNPGNYSANINLSSSLKYRLKVLTRNGKQYVTDYLVAAATPPIDSVTWQQPDNLKIFVHTHDPSNNTHFYRWEFTETWEYHAYYDSNLDFVNGHIVFRNPGDQTYSCWSSQSSGAIIIGNTTALTEDVVSYQPVTIVQRPSVKASYKYSILVRQVGLTQEAFNFWSILRKNTELTGTLFDPQPSQMPSNIHCMNDPNEQVIGYISAGVVSEQRIFIKNADLLNWQTPGPDSTCKPVSMLANPISAAEAYLNSDTSYGPAYFFPMSPTFIALAKKPCMDCRRNGGSNIKPPFWQ